MKLPKSVQFCPIVDSVIEIRFETELDPAAVFGLFYEQIKFNFHRVDRLPLADLPESIRRSDPSMIFKPLYKLVGENYVCQIGANVLSVGSSNPYQGWSKFSEITFDTFNRIFKKQGLIDKVIRLGIRYTNFFDQNIFSDSNCTILINNKEIKYLNTQLITEIELNGFNNRLILSNNSLLERRRSGSILDVDTFRIYQGEKEFLRIFKDELEAAHTTEKEIFWSLLSDQAKAKLKPTY